MAQMKIGGVLAPHHPIGDSPDEAAKALAEGGAGDEAHISAVPSHHAPDLKG